MQSCIAIIVSYNPELSVLIKQINSLLAQVKQILLIDNASLQDPFELLNQNFNEQQLSQIVTQRFLSNQGVAAAYNYGIGFAQKALFSHVLLMDQDSVPDSTMVEQLLFAEKLLLEQSRRPAALGSNYSDREDNITTYINSENCPVKRQNCTQKKQLIACDHVISSGSLISLSTLNQVGLMDERLFIDLVDVEWGLRAKSMGYQSYAVCNANMCHLIGEDNHKISIINKRVNIHSALRYYYQFRNSFLLYRRDYVSWCWISYHFTPHILFKLAYCLIFTAPRIENLKMMLLGIYHGFIGKSGKLL
ncbi:MAG: glycosyltransferase family 2 protein [gamma proteobacterium symbiont of Taylorina sp.]|nr:glycosyltransferase family 2 protein [gamma proteobacterium symbiont of Taylorina sp.]